MTARFTRFAAIDWSGAKGTRHKGIAVAVCEIGDAAPVLVIPPERHWSRTAILDWLLDQATTPTLIGLDLSPSLPHADVGSYFPGWGEAPDDARSLWAFIDRIAADDPDFASCSFVGHPEASRHFRRHRALGDLFPGGTGRMRACEIAQRDSRRLSPTSCFNLVGAAQVGKSSLTGMRLLHRLDGAIPVWPFDPLPSRGAAIVEIYTSIAAIDAGRTKSSAKIRDAVGLDTALANLGAAPHAPLTRYDDHATDAILTAAWLRANADRADLWHPSALTTELARTEGWTFGVA